MSYNFPVSFIRRMKARLGAEAEAFFSAMEVPAPVSVRYNPSKEEVPDSLERVPWCNTGVFLAQRPVFTLDPLLHAGCYYVQEASSMFLEQAIKQLGLQSGKICALDLCAAPGGKTTHLASLLHPESLIVSNEVIQSRIPALKENNIKWGSGNVIVTQNDPADFSGLESFFDLIVVDAPCSGEGLFRKDAGAVNHWSEQSCEQCVHRQKRILHEILPCIKPGGRLVYSTCTYNENENEEQVRWLVNEKKMIPEKLDVASINGVTEIQCEPGTGYAFYPHKIKGEGFFLSVFRKAESDNSARSPKIKNGLEKIPAKFSYLREWLKPEAAVQLFIKNNYVIALPGAWINEIELLASKLRIKYSGVTVAELKGDPKPAHELAMYRYLNRDAFPLVVLDEQHALNYLRRDALKISSAQNGWHLVAHKEKILGWINQLGHRSNNYYPVEWRIRMK